jgi:hypothetical protein
VDEHPLPARLAQPAEALLALAQLCLVALPRERPAEGAGGGAEGVELGGAPQALGQAFIEAEESPALLAGDDRDDRDGEDVLGVEDRALRRRKLAGETVDRIARQQCRRPALQPEVQHVGVLELGVVDLRRDSRRDPLMPLGHAEHPVFIREHLEDVDATHFRGLAEAREDLGDAPLPVRVVQEPGRCEGDCPEDGLAGSEGGLEGAEASRRGRGGP